MRLPEKTADGRPIKALYLNKNQRRFHWANAFESYQIWPRGEGKTEGPIRDRVIECLYGMPRSTGVMVGPTFRDLLTKTVPPLIASFEAIGLRRDVHFVIGKTPPRSWPRPFRSPLDHRYFIAFHNGSGIHLVSQDRPGSANGISIDWIIGDEAKFLKPDRLNSELIPANRGNGQHFGPAGAHPHPLHHSLLFCTDMPTTVGGQWILDKENSRTPKQKEAVDLILDIQRHLATRTNRYYESGRPLPASVEAEVKRWQHKIQLLRRDAVDFYEAEPFQNVAVLGIEYYEQMQRILTPFEFRTSILNERILATQRCFYAGLDEERHGYHKSDYDYLDNLDYDFVKVGASACQADGDIDRRKPLDIAFDYGGSINTLVVGQRHGREYRFLNAINVLHPDKLQDLCKKFCDYYESLPCKEVVYYYDHTARPTDAVRTETYSQTVTSYLRSRGWKVVERYIGQALTHKDRYEAWAMAFQGDHPKLPAVAFNLNNCEKLIVSMQRTELIETKDGIAKDKRTERRANYPQESAPHYSDAADTLFVGQFLQSKHSMDPIQPVEWH